MRLARRQFLAASGILVSASSLPSALRATAAATAAPSWPKYRDVMVIDSCGEPGRDTHEPVRPPLDGKELADIRASGVTAINFTVGAVASYSKDYNETVQNIAFWDSEIARHPQALLKIVHGAQLDEAKRDGKLGVVYGFQDTTMYGENLDRFDMFHNF